MLLVSRSGRITCDQVGLGGQLRLQRRAVETCACDSGDASNMVAFFGSDAPAGVLHAAGMADRGLLMHLEARRLLEVCAPKASGAWHLHICTCAVPFEAQIFFSSVAAGLGNVGQASYAMGNAWLDAQALMRRAHGDVARALERARGAEELPVIRGRLYQYPL